MQIHEIPIDSSLRELTYRGTPMFPLEMYDNDIRRFSMRCVPWHWHAEVELLLIVEGKLALEFGGGRKTLHAGDGAFINSNRLHAMRPVESEPCRMVNLVFDPEIVGGAAYSVFESKYVKPVLENEALDVLPLSRENAWQREALDVLRSCCEAYAPQAFGYELKLRSLLSKLWLLLAEKSSSAPKRSEGRQEARIKSLISFISENYARPLSLDEIARSANIDPRTCCRCFREQLGTSAMAFLKEYRVKAASDMLLTSDRAITQVCFDTGFGSTSYFTRVFRETTGLTPSEFRKEKTAFAPEVR